MIIEKGKIDDIDEIEALYNELNDALKQGINYPGWKKGVYPVRENAVKGISENNLYVVKINNKIVGSLILNHEPEQGYETVKWLCDAEYNKIFVIRTFIVHPQYFKKGIGMKMMNFAEETARISKMSSMRLDVFENNIPAIKLYEKYGFQYIDTIDLGLGEYGLDWFRVYEKILK